jgi:hypothetical protein
MFIKNAATPCRITNLPSNLQQTVDTLFPEGRHPDPSMIRPDVFAYVTQDNTNISFTFISTGAGNKNRLGYARYNSLTNSVIGNPYMAFPRINTNNGVGCLRQGDTYKFGKFNQSDMVIFFLDSDSNIADRFWSYVNAQFPNPDTSQCNCATGYVHGSWAYLTNEDITLFGFEDLKLGDADYNDVMFFLTYEGGLDYNEIPPYENGTLKVCNIDTQVSQRSYVVNNCTQWGILESTAEQSCLTYMSIPSGWTWASVNDPAAISIINQFANSQWSYTAATCFLLSTNATHGVGYTSTGAVCDPSTYSIKTLYNATSGLYCYNAACSSRFVLRGADLGASCSSTSRCVPSVAGSILPGGIVSTYSNPNDAYQYPDSYSVFLRTTNGFLDLTASLRVGDTSNTRRKIDVFVMYDMTGVASNKRTSAATSFKGVRQALYDRGLDPRVGLAVYRPSAHTATAYGMDSDYQLTSTQATLDTWATNKIQNNAAYDSSCPSTGKHHSAAAWLLEASRGINWRTDSYKVLWIVSGCSASTTSSPLAAAVVNSGIHVMYSSPMGNNYPSGWATDQSYTPIGFVRWRANSGNQDSYHDEPFRTTQDTDRGAYVIAPYVSKVRGYVVSDAAGFVVAPSTDFVDIPSTGVYAYNYRLSWPNGLAVNQAVSSYSATLRILGRSAVANTINFNHNPVIPNINLNMVAGENRTITFVPSDPDSNVVTMTVTSVPDPAIGSLYRTDTGALITAGTTLPAGVYSMVLATVKTSSGTATWQVAGSDGCATTNANANIVVTASNSAPVAQNFGITMQEDSLATGTNGQINFAPWISDIDNPAAAQTLTVYVTSLPTSRGTLNSWVSNAAGTPVSLGAVGNLTRFVLGTNAGFGVVTFNYRVSDGFLTSNQATVTINITHVNHPPTLSFPVTSFNVYSDSITDQPIAATITDSDGAMDTVNLFITASTLTATNNFQVKTDDTTFQNPYTVSPQPQMFNSYYGSTSTSFPVSGLNWNRNSGTGSGTVTFQAKDNSGALSNTVTVTFGVTSFKPPTWVAKPAASFNIVQGGSITSGLVYSATDEDLSPTVDWSQLNFTLQAKSAQATITLRHTSSGAAVTLAQGSSFTKISNTGHVTTTAGPNTSAFTLNYVPSATFYGTDSFTFTVMDSHLLYATESVTVTVNVARADTAPVSANSIMRGLENTITSTDIPLYSTNDAAENEVILQLLTVDFPGVLYLGPGATNQWFVGANTSVVVSPPGAVTVYARGQFGAFSDPSTSPVGTFTYRVIEPGTATNNVGPTYTGQIFLDHVNHPPTSVDQSHTIKKREVLQVTLPASDPDADDPSTTLTASINSIAFTSKGEFFSDASLSESSRIDSAFITAGGLLTGRTFWYRSMTEHSLNGQPLATYTFTVKDKQGLTSDRVYNGRIVVDFAGDVPTYGGDDSVTTNQETPVPMVLAVGVVTESGTAPVVRVLDLPQKGQFSACDNNGICTPVTSISEPGLVLTSDTGRVVFLPQDYDWDQNFTKFRFSLTDPLSGAVGIYTMHIHVIHINKSPFIQAMNFLTTAETNQGIIVNESTSHAFSWRAWDQDSLPATLQTSLRVSFYTTQGFSLYQCTGNAADWLSTSTCTFDPSVPFAVRADFTKNAKRTITSYSTTTTSCADFTALRAKMGAVDRNCEAQFKFTFVPTPGASYTPYISINFMAIDDQEAESTAISATIWVKAVNTPPTIYSPPVVLGTQGITNPFIRNTDQNSAEFNNPVIVNDEDHNLNYELLTISVNSGFSGNLIYPNNAPCAVDPANSQVWHCLDRIPTFAKWLGDLRFEVTSGEQADLTFTINDMGHTSDWKPSQNLTASSQTSIKITPAVLAPKGNSSTLAIAVGVAAAVGLLLLGALGFFLRKAVAPPKDDYFSAATTPLSAAPQSPLYQAQNQTHENALYKARS